VISQAILAYVAVALAAAFALRTYCLVRVRISRP